MTKPIVDYGSTSPGQLEELRQVYIAARREVLDAIREGRAEACPRCGRKKITGAALVSMVKKMENSAEKLAILNSAQSDEHAESTIPALERRAEIAERKVRALESENEDLQAALIRAMGE